MTEAAHQRGRVACLEVCGAKWWKELNSRHMMKDFLCHQKEKKNPFVTTWLLIYWFPSSIFSSRVLRKSKAISEFVGCCYIPLANGHSAQKHTHANTHFAYNPRAQTHGAPSGAEFLILKYTAINQTPLPHAPARLSQWKAQAGGTLIAIYRASHARRGVSTERPLFCNSLLLFTQYTDTELLNSRRWDLPTASHPSGCHSCYTTGP